MFYNDSDNFKGKNEQETDNLSTYQFSNISESNAKG